MLEVWVLVISLGVAIGFETNSLLNYFYLDILVLFVGSNRVEEKTTDSNRHKMKVYGRLSSLDPFVRLLID